MAHDRGECVLLQTFKRFCIPEKSSHIDQDIIEQGFDLIAVLAKKLQICGQIVDFAKEHPPVDAPFDGAGLVIAEIDVAEVPKQKKDFRERLILRRLLFGLRG